MNYLEKFLFERLHSNSFSPKYKDAVQGIIYRLYINSTYHAELGAIIYKPKNKDWLIKKQYEG